MSKVKTIEDGWGCVPELQEVSDNLAQLREYTYEIDNCVRTTELEDMVYEMRSICQSTMEMLDQIDTEQEFETTDDEDYYAKGGTTKGKMKVLEELYFNGRQSVEFEGLYEYKGEKLKVQIDIDSYDIQSRAVIEIYDKKDNKWNFLAKIPYDMMYSLEPDDNGNAAVFYQRKAHKLDWFERDAIKKDIRSLLRKAENIL